MLRAWPGTRGQSILQIWTGAPCHLGESRELAYREIREAQSFICGQDERRELQYFTHSLEEFNDPRKVSKIGCARLIGKLTRGSRYMPGILRSYRSSSGDMIPKVVWKDRFGFDWGDWWDGCTALASLCKIVLSNCGNDRLGSIERCMRCINLYPLALRCRFILTDLGNS